MPQNPTKEGYTFVGWYTDIELTNEYDFNSLVTSDLVLYAKWAINEYTITFNSNGGSSAEAQKVNHNEKVVMPQNPTKDGYDFAGWYLDTELSLAYDFNSLVTSDLVLYAKWAINAYTISFISNGGSTVDEITVDANNQANKPQNPTKEGYTFVGWYSDIELTNEYDFNSLVTSDLVLYAKWAIKTYTITFNSNGGSSVESQKVNHNEKVVVPEEPTLEGYAFIAWYSDERLNSKYDFDTLVTSDLVLYACWRKVYNITFNNNGHGDTPSSFISDNLGKLPELEEEGYVFEGWYLDSSYTIKACDDFILNKDITLYAKWIEVISSGSVNLEEGKAYYVDATKFTIEGDPTIYYGNTIFYVTKTGIYNIVIVEE